MSSKSLTIDSNFLALWFWGNFKMFTQVVFNNPFNLSSIGALKSFNWLNCGWSKLSDEVKKLNKLQKFRTFIKIFSPSEECGYEWCVIWNPIYFLWTCFAAQRKERLLFQIWPRAPSDRAYNEFPGKRSSPQISEEIEKKSPTHPHSPCCALEWTLKHIETHLKGTI